MRTIAQTIVELKPLIGQRVRVSVGDVFEDPTAGLCVHAHGILEQTDEDEKTNGAYYVRIANTREGSNGVSFLPKHVQTVEQLPSGLWVVDLQ